VLNRDPILAAIEARAVADDDGSRWVRAATVARLLGRSQSVIQSWERAGWIACRRIRIRPRNGAPTGTLALLPLEAVLAILRDRYQPAESRRYTEREDDLLMQWLGDRTVEQIARRLGRTVNSVRARAGELGLTPRSNQGLLTVGEVARRLGRTRVAVLTWVGDWLPARRAPGRDRAWLIDPADLARLIRLRRQIMTRLSPRAVAWLDAVPRTRVRRAA
jgi:hypothetical protein